MFCIIWSVVFQMRDAGASGDNLGSTVWTLHLSFINNFSKSLQSGLVHANSSKLSLFIETVMTIHLSAALIKLTSLIGHGYLAKQLVIKITKRVCS